MPASLEEVSGLVIAIARMLSLAAVSKAFMKRSNFAFPRSTIRSLKPSHRRKIDHETRDFRSLKSLALTTLANFLGWVRRVRPDVYAHWVNRTKGFGRGGRSHNQCLLSRVVHNSGRGSLDLQFWLVSRNRESISHCPVLLRGTRTLGAILSIMQLDYSRREPGDPYYGNT